MTQIEIIPERTTAQFKRSDRYGHLNLLNTYSESNRIDPTYIVMEVADQVPLHIIRHKRITMAVNILVKIYFIFRHEEQR